MFLVDSLPSGNDVMLARFFADDLWPMKRLYSAALALPGFVEPGACAEVLPVVCFVVAVAEPVGVVPLLSRLLLFECWADLLEPLRAEAMSSFTELD